MTNPVLVDVTRGGIAESEHRGAIAIIDASGKVVLDLGDIDRPIFPRSAIKGLQAIPLIESGAADQRDRLQALDGGAGEDWPVNIAQGENDLS